MMIIMLIRLYLWIALVIYVVKTNKLCEENETNASRTLINCSNLYLEDFNYSSAFDQVEEIQNNKSRNHEILMILDGNEVNFLDIIPEFPQIVEISLKNNHIKALSARTFQNLPQIRNIDLSGNNLASDSINAETFKTSEYMTNYTLLSLKHLNLRNNEIKFLKPDVFLYIPNLLTLDLSHNPISIMNSETNKAFHHLCNLKEINLAYTGLFDMPDGLFDETPIEKLFLNGNNLKSVPKSVKKNSVTYLNINDNPISELDCDSFTNLSSLQELHASGMRNLAEIKDNAFSSLVHSLEILDCSYNPNLKFISPKAFETANKKNINLKELCINNNNLQFIFEDMIYWHKLSIFKIQENPWNCTCSLLWLLNFVENRQNYDPEANLGTKCKYPQLLENESLTSVKRLLQCPEVNKKIISNNRTAFKYIFCMTVLIVFSFLLYYAVIKKLKTRIRFKNYGSSIKSPTKYKRAHLNDVET